MRPRLLISIILIVSLLLTAGTRYWAVERRDLAMRIPGQIADAGETQRSSLANMNSYALALLLGGLRGPLVMILWQQSEAQKSARNLEGVDTMIEWIRLLQPEFDTVHLFQIWNKAYNISVQMASLANKYAVILDAIDYARSLEREKPNDINIIYAIGQTYFDKLGNSAEKDYYRRRVREETMYRPPSVSPSVRQVGYRSNRLESMLDQQGDLLPELVKPMHPRPVDWPSDQPWNDGAPMQYLVSYQPFPEGLSPFAISYDYFKRAQTLLRVGGQHHIQISDMVVDSRPALALKNWSEEEWERGRRFELAAFDRPVPDERLDMELPTADLSAGSTLARSQDIDDAIFSYTTAYRIAMDAIPEYESHLKSYTINLSTYQSHIAHLRGVILLNRADELYLRGVIEMDVVKKHELLSQAAVQYAQSIRQFERVILRYFTADQILAAISSHQVTKLDIEGLGDQQLDHLMLLRDQFVKQTLKGQDPNGEDAQEYMTYITRAAHRLAQIDKVSSMPTNDGPTTSAK